jgi:hypothetical protein
MRTCSVCSGPDRQEIDQAIVSGRSKRGIARRFAVSPDAVERHARAHLPAALAKAKEAGDALNGDALLRQIQDLQKRTLAILTTAEKDKRRHGLALGAIRQARENVALLSKLVAELPTAAKPARPARTWILTWGDLTSGPGRPSASPEPNDDSNEAEGEESPEA